MTPENIGRYEVERELGQGGMAVVLLGRDPLVKRQVAIKVLPGQFSTAPDLRTRFQREAEIIAALEHPAIVPIYDYGEEKQQPYIVMRYMPGGSLADRLRRGPLNLEDAAHILERVGSALDRAHAQGIIHRDLKPGNILFDQYGDAYLSDFGIARLAEASVALTGSGVIGTPAYMSPEQVYGDAVLDSRSDIYALGVILFEMLTGQIPYEADTPAKIMMKHILDPVPRIRAVRPDLPDNCEALIERAMAKEVDKRYATAAAMVADVSQLTPPRPAASPISLPTAAGVGTVQAASISHGDDTAIMAEPVAPSPQPPPVGRPAALPARQLNPDQPQTGEPAVAPPTSVAKPAFPWRWVVIGLAALIMVLVVAGGLILVLANLGGAEEEEPTILAAGEETAAGSEGAPLPEMTLVELARFGRGSLDDLAISPDGQTLAGGGSLGIWLYDTNTWEPIRLLEGHADTVSSVAWSPDSMRLVSGSWDGSVKVWDVASGDYVQAFHDLDDLALAVDWAPDNQTVAAGTYSGTVYIWNSDSGEQLASLYGHEAAVRSLAWSPDGTQLASGGEDGQIVIWDTANGEEIYEFDHQSTVRTIVWVADDFLFSGSDDGQVWAWDPNSGEQLDQYQAHEYEVNDLEPSPDGQYLASAGGDGYIRVWHSDGQGLITEWADYGDAPSLAWLADNEHLAVAFSDQVLRLWHVPSQTERENIQQHTGPITGLDLAPDETAAATGYENLGVGMWHIDGQAELIADYYTSESNGGGVAWSPDGSQLAFTYVDAAVIWDLAAAEEALVLSLDDESYVNGVAWSPEGDLLAVVGWSEVLRVWSAESGELILEIEAPGSRNVAWSPDGHLLATTGGSDQVYIWNAESGESVVELVGHDEEVAQAAWSEDGRFLASASIDGTVSLWSVGDWEEVDSFGDGSSAMTTVAWSADGQYLATGNWMQIWLWSVNHSDEPLAILDGHVGQISGLHWLVDGQLVSAGHDGTLRLWGPPPAE